VSDTIPEGFTPPKLDEEPQMNAPGIDMDMFNAAKKLVLG